MDALKNMNKELLLTICFIVLGIILLSVGSIMMLTSDEGKKSDKPVDTPVKEVDEEEEIFNTNSKNEKYISLLTNSIDFVKEKVNSSEYDFSLSDTLYLVPVGTDKCVNIDGVSKSPYDGTWEYFYVGVKKVDEGYQYYALALDSSGYGVELKDEDTLNTAQEFIVVYVDNMTPLGLKDVYLENKDVTYSDIVGDGFTSIDELEGSDELKFVSGCSKIVISSTCK